MCVLKDSPLVIRFSLASLYKSLRQTLGGKRTVRNKDSFKSPLGFCLL